jgi:hypothetical protein
MLIAVLAVLAVLSPALFGGELRRLAEVRLRAVWLPLAALLAQVVIIEVLPEAPRLVLESVHLATYVAAGAFIVVNRHVPGVWLIAAGAAMNGITIALNDGTLPANPQALALAGIQETPGEFINSAALPDPVLPLLGDIFAWPAPLPLANVFSVGDVLVVFGAFYGAQRICRSRLVKSPIDAEWDQALALANGDGRAAAPPAAHDTSLAAPEPAPPPL